MSVGDHGVVATVAGVADSAAADRRTDELAQRASIATP